VLIQVLMVGLVIAFPQMVMVYKAGETKLDIKQIQIIVPEEQPAPGAPGQGGAAGTPGGQEQEDAEKALEKALGGGAPAPEDSKAPDQKGAAPAPATPSPSSEQEDAMKALERAMQPQSPPPK